MPRLALLTICLSISTAAAEVAVAADAASQPVANFTLRDYRGRERSLSDLDDRPLVVLAVLGVDCPLAKLYGPRLAELARRYESRGVAVWGLNPNRQDSITELAAYARRHEIDFPLLKDLNNQVADALGATRTPEVFILDAQRVIRYQGRVDDQYGIGYVRDEPQRRDLEIALDELLAGKPVSVPSTPAVGCLIGRVRAVNESGPVTYSQQISRLLQDRCVECHRPGDIGPFPLTTYDEAVGWADMMVEVVEQRRMPPWHADPRHGEFADDRRLSDKEIELLRRWAADGAPQGDPAQLPPSREFAEGWQLATPPDLVLEMASQPFRVPAEGAVKYQYFAVDPQLDEDKWIRAAEVMPGNRAVVHHVLVVARRDERGSPDEARGFLAAYVPGFRARPYPDGMAKRISAGSKLVFQVHYTPTGSEQLDLTRLGLWFADDADVTHEVRTASAVTRRLSIPPHADNHRVEATSSSTSDEVLLLTMMPHMHLRGKAFRYDLRVPGAEEQTLLDIPRYDFNWQTAYRLKQPLALPPGSRLHCVAHYDNSADNLNNPDPDRTVGWGDQTWDEMMIGYFDVAVARSSKAGADDDAAKERPVAAAGRALLRGAAIGVMFTRLDADGDGQLSPDEVPERSRHLFGRADTDGNGRLSRDEFRRFIESQQARN